MRYVPLAGVRIFANPEGVIALPVVKRRYRVIYKIIPKEYIENTENLSRVRPLTL